MKIQDYAHFYIGAEVDCMGNNICILHLWEYNENFVSIKAFLSSDYYKLRLRPIGSITDEEIKEVRPLGSVEIIRSVYSANGSYVENNISILDFSKDFKYLLSKHFDLFNLIPSGLALDATKLTTPVK